MQRYNHRMGAHYHLYDLNFCEKVKVHYIYSRSFITQVMWRTRRIQTPDGQVNQRWSINQLINVYLLQVQYGGYVYSLFDLCGEKSI